MSTNFGSVEYVVKYVIVAKDLIHRWNEHKGLSTHEVGRLWKFKISEVDDWVRAGDADGERLDHAGGEARG